MLALVTALQLSAAVAPQAPAQEDSLPAVTLEEALLRATELDPNYVAAMRQVVDAEWTRRSAWSVFLIPAISAQLNARKFSSEFFNIGTGEPASQIVDATIDARWRRPQRSDKRRLVSALFSLLLAPCSWGFGRTIRGGPPASLNSLLC